MFEALHYKLETTVETYCSIDKKSYTCDSVYIFPPHEYMTKGGYKKPMPRLKLNKIKKVKEMLASRPTIQDLVKYGYNVAADSKGFYFREEARITEEIK
jgi:hypothetical protein